MNILLGCLSFKEYTGSEIYFYELSTALIDAGHSVNIFSLSKDAPLMDKVEEAFFVDEYSVDNVQYDLVIFSHSSLIWEHIKNVNTKKIINVIHSEVIELEEPCLSPKIDLYVGIRPSIVEFIKTKVPKNKQVKLIYNPFNFNRFNPSSCKKENKKDKVVLFPGSLDYLRLNPIKYLLDLSEKQNFKVIHVGRNDYNITHDNFSTHPPVWSVEQYYKQCDIVSGIFLGRTSIEGLLCEKKVLQFDVDSTGRIKKVYWHTEDNLEKFNKNNTVKELINV